MAETKITLKRRVPDEKRLAWARETVAGIQGPVPHGQACELIDGSEILLSTPLLI